MPSAPCQRRSRSVTRPRTMRRSRTPRLASASRAARPWSAVRAAAPTFVGEPVTAARSSRTPRRPGRSSSARRPAAARPRTRRGRGRGHRGQARRGEFAAAAERPAVGSLRADGRPRHRAGPLRDAFDRSPASEAFTCSRSWARPGSGSRGSPGVCERRRRPGHRGRRAVRAVRRGHRSGRCARSSASSPPAGSAPTGTRPDRSPRNSATQSASRTPPWRREEIFWATRSLFTTLAGERPRRLLRGRPLGGATFLDLVEYLAETAERAPIFLVCITRPELLEHRPDWTRERRNAGSWNSSPSPTRTARR